MRISQTSEILYLITERLIPVASTSAAFGIGIARFVAVSDFTESELAELGLYKTSLDAPFEG